MASAERWTGTIHSWSGSRARDSQLRQKRVVAVSRALASSRSAGEASPSAHESEQYSSSPSRRGGARAPVALDAEGHVGAQADRLARAGRVGDVAVVADERPLPGHAAVVEDRLAHELDLDVAVDAADRPDQQVLGVVVGRRPRVRRDRVLALPRAHGQRVADDDPAARRVPRRLEDVRPRLVAAAGGDVDPERRQAEVAGLAVEQRAEHARRVEARDAQPADARRRARSAPRCGSRR